MTTNDGWTMLVGEDADAALDRYIAAHRPKGTRPLHAQLRAENEHLRLSLLTMAARERETAAERDALRVMLAEARERSVGCAAFDAIDAENTRLRSLLSKMHGAVGMLANSHLLREDKLQAIAHDLVLSALLAHPLPWRVEQDWTHEVTAADGTIIAKCMTYDRAAAIVAMAQAIRADLDTPTEEAATDGKGDDDEPR